MQIRHRLTLVFLASVASILGLSFLAIYFLSAEDRKNTYYDRLSNRARTTARLMIEVEEVEAYLLMIIYSNKTVVKFKVKHITERSGWKKVYDSCTMTLRHLGSGMNTRRAGL